MKNQWGAIAALGALILAGCGGADSQSGGTEADTGQHSLIAQAYEQCGTAMVVVAAYREAKDGHELEKDWDEVTRKVAKDHGVTVAELEEQLASEVVSYDAPEDTLVLVRGYEQSSNGNLLNIGWMGGWANECVMDVLSPPERVLSHMRSTRALDGTQTDSWDGYEARWTYHPDDGTYMTIWASE